jgi:hypothetical protein
LSHRHIPIDFGTIVIYREFGILTDEKRVS